MEFNQLIEHVQNLIFKRITTSELIACGQVCHQWQQLQESEFFVRHTLVLLIGDATALDTWTDSCFNEYRCYNKIKKWELVKMDTVPNSPQYLAKWYGLKVNGAFTFELAQYLVRKMPNIKRLIVSSTEPSLSWTQSLPFMLGQWSANLETVKLCVQVPDQLTTQQRINVHMILGVLNACPMLDHLTVDFNQWLVEAGSLNVRLNLPILSQLSEFYFGSTDNPQLLIESFTRYAQSNDNRLTRIGHRCASSDVDFSREYNALEMDLTAKFTHLLVDSDSNDTPDDGHLANWPFIRIHYTYSNMCKRFDQLTQLHLNIDMDRVHYHLVMAQLARLTRLEVLSLNIQGDRDLEGEGDDQIGPLPSVRVLKLCIVHQSHDTINELRLQECFLKLEYIEVQFCGTMECFRCQHDGTQTDSANIVLLEQCIRWSLMLIRMEQLNLCKISFSPELHAVLPNCNYIVQDELGKFMA